MLQELFTLSNLGTLMMLIVLQAVLGFDNLLYISLESKRVAKEKQSYVRKLGIGLAIFLRIALLFTLYFSLKYFQSIFLTLDNDYIEVKVNIHSLIVSFGGLFIIYTAIKEIWHMIGTQNLEQSAADQRKGTKSSKTVIFSIVLMNLVFSFDSILAAIGLTSAIESTTTAFIIMTIAIVISGLLMLFLADKISEFLAKNRMYEVLGLFILFIVGIMLLTEGAHLAHMHVFENPILPMSKTTFYFTIFILIIIDIIQLRYQKILVRKK